jgi:hypothetical protein
MDSITFIIVYLSSHMVKGQDTKYSSLNVFMYRFCGLVVRVPAYRSRCPGFDSRRYQIFWEVVGLERGPLNVVRITEELLKKNCCSGLDNRD